MMHNEAKFQIGKNKITQEVLTSIETRFKNHSIVRVAFLKNSTRDQEEFKKMAEELRQGLSFPVSMTKLGFTLILKKQKNAKNSKSKRL